MILFIIAWYLLSTLTLELNLFKFGISMIIAGFAASFGLVCSIVGALTAVPKQRSGNASGLFFTCTWISNALGVAFSGVTISLFSKEKILHLLNINKLHFDNKKLELLENMASGITNNKTGEHIKTFPAGIEALTSQAFIESLHIAAFIISCLAFSGIVVLFLLKNHSK
jgi:hypothetical protein